MNNFILTSSLLFTAIYGLILPPPNGPFSVAMTAKPLTDYKRLDPYAPHREYRSVMISMYLPIDTHGHSCSTRTVPYMTPLVGQEYDQIAASAGLSGDIFSSLEMQVCTTLPSKPCRPWSTGKAHQFPTVIFSPGLGNPRLLYGEMARTIASFGYAVVTVDHPYDASIVEFPDGKVVRAANIDPSNATALTMATNVRAADLSFILDQLHNPVVMAALCGVYAWGVDVDNVIAGGHSFGGATAAAVMLNDSRFLAGIDMDGELTEPAESAGLDKPFVLFGRPHHSAQDPTWDVFWDHLRGPRCELEYEGAVHGTFTDFPILLSYLDLNLTGPQKQGLEQLVGTEDWSKVGNTIAEVFNALSRFVTGKRATSILTTGNKKYPMIKVLDSDF